MGFIERNGELVFEPAPDGPQPRWPWTRQQKFAAGAGIVIAGFIALSFVPTSDSGMAETMCQEFVKDRLKSPSSADFAGTRSTLRGSTYEVTGRVDSENSFGASLRSTYTCQVSKASDGAWKLSSLDVS